MYSVFMLLRVLPWIIGALLVIWASYKITLYIGRWVIKDILSDAVEFKDTLNEGKQRLKDRIKRRKSDED